MAVVVADELGVCANESLAQAAFRVLRHNTAPARAQQVARIIAGSGQGPKRKQWEAIERCCEIILGPRPKPKRPAN
jgi:hypothetical protein